MSVSTTVLYIRNDEEWSSPVFEGIMEELPHEFYEKANRFRFWNDRQAFILGKLLIKKVLEENTNLSLIDVKYSEYGKPYVEGELSFNISHSGKYVVCFYSLTRNSMGIDIEKKDSKINIRDFEEVLTNQESEKIKGSKDELNSFFEIWTMKEASMKADGRGLNIPLREIEIGPEYIDIEKTKWYYQRVLIHEDYKCHTVMDSSDFCVSIEELKLKNLMQKQSLPIRISITEDTIS